MSNPHQNALLFLLNKFTQDLEARLDRRATYPPKTETSLDGFRLDKSKPKKPQLRPKKLQKRKGK